jgi:parallel beta-helix repeat protein
MEQGERRLESAAVAFLLAIVGLVAFVSAVSARPAHPLTEASRREAYLRTTGRPEAWTRVGGRIANLRDRGRRDEARAILADRFGPASGYAAGRLLVLYRDGGRGPAGRGRGGLAPGRRFERIGVEAASTGGRDVLEAIIDLAGDPAIEYVEPDFILRGAVVPNDTYYPQQWDMTDIGCESVWATDTGSTEVVVGVIDSGGDVDHPDLVANYWTDSAGKTGRNAITETNDPDDDHGHGTHVAGTIGAVGNNGQGVAGVNWRTRIVNLKFINASNEGLTSDAIELMEWVLERKAEGVNIKVTNNSWGSPSYSQALYDAIKNQMGAGILFVTAAGNDGDDLDRDTPQYPACYDLPNIITVVNYGSNGQLAASSNRGRQKAHIGAPGQIIWSTLNGDTWSIKSGTSMAAPHVTGALALLFSRDTAMDWRIARDRLLATTTETTTMESYCLTAGKLNLVRLMANDSRSVFASILPIDSTAAGANIPMTLRAAWHGPNRPVSIAAAITISGGDTTITLKDDGVAPDLAANDGIFSATWTPLVKDTYRIEYSANVQTRTVRGVISGGSTWYLNDTSTAGDLWCTAQGDDANDGQSPATPKRNWASLQALITHGDTVLIDSGVYYPTAKWSIDFDNVTIRGADSATTLIVFDSNASAAARYMHAQNRTGIAISDLSVTGGYYGIYYQGTDLSSIRRVRADTSGSIGIYLRSGSETNRVENCVANGNPTYGFRVSESSGNTLEGNAAAGNSFNGFIIYQSVNCTFIANTARANTAGGFLVSLSSSGNTFSGNIADSNAGYGFRVSGSTLNTFSGDTATRNTSYGFVFASTAETNTLTNCLTETNHTGFRFDASSGNTVNGGLSRGNTNYGALIYNGATGNTIRGLEATGNTSYGIVFDTAVGNTVEYCTITANNRGVHFQVSSNANLLQGNRIHANVNHGIFFSSSNGNSAIANTIAGNGSYGVYLSDASNNYFARNTLDSNANYEVYLTGACAADTFDRNNILPSIHRPDSGVFNNTATAFEFLRNWWGTADSASVAAKRAGTGASVIAYHPWRLGMVDTTVGADTVAPAAPDTVAVAETGPTTARITWAASSLDEGGGALTGLAGYRIYRSQRLDTSLWVARGTVAAGTTTFTDSGLAYETGYHYRVTAYDTASPWPNESFYSDSIVSCTTAPQPNFNAEFVSQFVPLVVQTETGYIFKVTMKNTGTETWTAADSYRLGSQNPQDNHFWIGWTSRAFLAASDTIAPGETVTFTINGTTPETPGLYNFQWRMIKEGVAWFGDSTTNRVIPVFSLGAPEIIETLDYFVSDHLETGMTGTHPQSQTVVENKSYMVKWDSRAFESHFWDRDWIYVQEDFTWGADSSYLFEPGKWMKRRMQPGESIDMSANQSFWYGPTGEIYDSYVFPYRMTLETRVVGLDMGGDLGAQDMLILKYAYTPDYERFYYSKEWGWIAWELYGPGNTLKAVSIFNQFGPAPIVPRQDFTLLAARELAPNAAYSPTFPSRNGTHRIDIEAGTFAESVTVAAYLAPSLADSPCPGYATAFTGVGLEIMVETHVAATKDVLVTLVYRDSDIAGLRETHLVVARLSDTAGIWQVLPSTVYADSNFVVARTRSFSRFRLMEAEAFDSQVKIAGLAFVSSTPEYALPDTPLVVSATVPDTIWFNPTGAGAMQVCTITIFAGGSSETTVAGSAIFTSIRALDTGLDRDSYTLVYRIDTNAASANLVIVATATSGAADTALLRFIADTAPPTVPLPLAPAADHDTTATTIRFQWTASIDTGAGLRHYRLQVDTSGAFTALVVDSVVVGATAETVTLSANDSYYWRVVARDSVSNETFALPRLLRIDTAPPVGLALAAPADSATQDSRPSFLWSGTAADSYRWQIATAADFAVIRDSLLTAATGHQPALIESGTYYWRVIASNRFGGVETSAARYLVVDTGTPDTTPPNPFDLASPANATETSRIAIRFRWNEATDSQSGIASYTLEISRFAGFTAIHDSRVLSGITTETTLILAANDTYWWRVIAADNAGCTRISTSARRILVDTLPPSLPALLSPIGGEETTATLIRFRWSTSVDTLSGLRDYRIQIAKGDTTFSSTVLDAWQSATETTPNLLFLTADTWYWRVLARDNVGCTSGWSATDSFRRPAPSDTTQPAPVGALTATPNTGATVTLTWLKSPSSGMAGGGQYNIYWDNATGAIDLGAPLAIVPHTADTFYSHTTVALPDSRYYSFIVRAQDSRGIENTDTVKVIAFIRTVTQALPIAIIRQAQSGNRLLREEALVTVEIAPETRLAEVDRVLFQFRRDTTNLDAAWDTMRVFSPLRPNPARSSAGGQFAIHWDVSGARPGNPLIPAGVYQIRATAFLADGRRETGPGIFTVEIVPAGADRRDTRLSNGDWYAEQKVHRGAENRTYAASDSAAAGVTIPENALTNATDTLRVTLAATASGAPSGKTVLTSAMTLTLGSGQTAFGSPVAIWLSYPDIDGDGIIDGTTTRASELELWHLSGGTWSKCDNLRVDTALKRIHGATTSFSEFVGVAGAVATNMANFTVAPNPFRPNDGNPATGAPYQRGVAATGIWFLNLPSAVTIEIYTVSGRKVTSFSTTNSGGSIQWDGRNDDVRDVASGYYLYVVTDGATGIRATGKLAVIR